MVSVVHRSVLPGSLKWVEHGLCFVLSMFQGTFYTFFSAEFELLISSCSWYAQCFVKLCCYGEILVLVSVKPDLNALQRRIQILMPFTCFDHFVEKFF